MRHLHPCPECGTYDDATHASACVRWANTRARQADAHALIRSAGVADRSPLPDKLEARRARARAIDIAEVLLLLALIAFVLGGAVVKLALEGAPPPAVTSSP